MENRVGIAKAKKVVNGRIGFYVHLAAFLIVNALLITINLVSSRGQYWFQWPLLGWGLGLIAHAAAVFLLPRIRGKLVEKDLQKTS